MVDKHSVTAEIRRGKKRKKEERKKEERKKKEETTGRKYNGLPVSVPLFVNFGLLFTMEFFKLWWCLHRKSPQVTPTLGGAAITWHFRATSSFTSYNI